MESLDINQNTRDVSTFDRDAIAENCMNYNQYLNNLVKSGIEIPNKLTCPICFNTIISVGALIHMEECMEWLKQFNGKKENQIKRKPSTQSGSSTIPIEVDESSKRIRRKSKECARCDLPESICPIESRRNQRIPLILYDGMKEIQV
jgi:hypothetical protein